MATVATAPARFRRQLLGTNLILVALSLVACAGGSSVHGMGSIFPALQGSGSRYSGRTEGVARRL